jgi:hypothetical protein
MENGWLVMPPPADKGLHRSEPGSFYIAVTEIPKIACVTILKAGVHLQRWNICAYSSESNLNLNVKS